MAIEAGQAMAAERFEQAVLLSQAMRFVGISVLIGVVAGFPFQQRGRLAWRKAMHALLHDTRYAEQLRIRNEEIARVEAAHAELKAREAAAEAKQKAAEEEANKGVQIDDLETPAESAEATETTETADTDKEEEPTPSETGSGGGFGEEDGDFDAEADEEPDEPEKPEKPHKCKRRDAKLRTRAGLSEHVKRVHDGIKRHKWK